MLPCPHASPFGHRGYHLCGGARPGKVVSPGVCAACQAAPISAAALAAPALPPCQETIPEWPEFQADATPEYRREADLILAQTNWSACQRATRLRHLIERWQAWRATLAALLLLACAALAAPLQAAESAPPPGRVAVEIMPDLRPENIPAAMRTQAILRVLGARAAARFPGMSRQAALKGYTVIVADRLLDAVGANGLHDGARKTIYIHPRLAGDIDRLRYVYAHEIGHAIWHHMPLPDRRDYLAEYGREVAAGTLPRVDAEELFADLVARIALGLLVDRLPETQRYIRGRLCQP